MKVGDKVRVIHGNEEGHVIKKLPNDLVEIETSDGFTIPVLEADLVLVASAEKDYFKKESGAGDLNKVQDIAQTGNKGLFICMAQYSDILYDVTFVNNTDNDVLCSVNKFTPQHQTTLAHGAVRSRSSLEIGKWNIQDLSTWPMLKILAISVSKKAFNFNPFQESEFKINTKVFKADKSLLPVLNKKGYSVQIDAVSKQSSSTSIQEQLDNNQPATPTKTLKKPEDKVDLHIEKLIQDHQQLTSQEIIRTQLEQFEKSLDAAIVFEMNAITFIHGIGNGKLKHEIHKKLSRRKDINYFEDAEKSKFGYGATKVVLK